MANTIKIKRNGTSSTVPTSLEHGELAINYADGKIFYKNSSNNIVEFSPSNTASFNVSDTAPASPSTGDVWINSTNRKYIFLL